MELCTYSLIRLHGADSNNFINLSFFLAIFKSLTFALKYICPLSKGLNKLILSLHWVSRFKWSFWPALFYLTNSLHSTESFNFWIYLSNIYLPFHHSYFYFYYDLLTWCLLSGFFGGRIYVAFPASHFTLVYFLPTLGMYVYWLYCRNAVLCLSVAKKNNKFSTEINTQS
jgi:hypothetical protein